MDKMTGRDGVNKEKLIKFAKEMDNCAKAAEIAAWIIGGILLWTFMVILGSKDYGETYSVISLDYLTLNLTEEARLPLEVQKFKMEHFIIILFPLMGAIIYASRLCRKILEPMKEGRPFEARCSKGIKKLGTLVLIAGVVIEVIKIFWRIEILSIAIWQRCLYRKRSVR